MYRWLAITLALHGRMVPSMVLSMLCVLFLFLPKFTFGDSAWWSCLLYHFSHANIFHLVLNLWALFQFRPRWKTCLVAYMSASVAALLPFVSLSIPTCGLSGLLMAAYARKYAESKLPIWKPIAANMAFVFIPTFNWKIHLVSFLLSYLVWRLKRK